MSLKPLFLAIFLAGTALAHAAETVAVDDSALRYYATHNEPERLAAELDRLKALYPDWTPPADLTTPAVDREAPLWVLFAKDDMAGLDKAIADLKATDPAFTLSDDLAGKIALKSTRLKLIDASTRQDQATVLSLATANPGLVGCGDLDVSWRVAAARQATGDIAGAKAGYEAILRDCKDDVAGRAATLSKAVMLFGPEATRDFSTGLISDAERESMRPAFARAAIVAAMADPTLPAADPDPADLAALQAAADAGPKPDDASLLAWWYRGKKQPAEALANFQSAATLAGTAVEPKIIEGIILSMVDLGQRDNAVRIAHDSRDKSAEIAKLYVDLGADRFKGEPRPEVESADYADYLAATENLKSAYGAETLGWYQFDRKNISEARRLFDLSLGWEPGENAAKGAILAAFADKDQVGATVLISSWSPTWPKLAEIHAPAAGKKHQNGGSGKDAIIVAFEAKDYRSCVAKADKRAAAGTLGKDLSLIRGWCLLKLNRPVDAMAAFELAESGPKKVRADAVYGKSLAMLAAGHVDSAAVVASAAISEPERRNEIGVAVLADRAQARFNAKDWRGTLEALDQRAAFAREPADLAMLRGWAYWHSGRRTEARQIFAMMDQTLSTKATRAALAQTQGY